MNALRQLYKYVVLLFLLLTTVASGLAQTYLTDVYKPTAEYHYQAYPTKGSDVMEIADFKYKGGFTLGYWGRGVDGKELTCAQFNLDGKYDKLSFVVGPINRFAAGDESNSLIAVRADGKRVLDRVVWCHDAPREHVIDVKGVNVLRFEMPKGENNVGFGAVKLWKAGETYKPVTDPMRRIPTTDRVQLVGQLEPYYMRSSGYMTCISSKDRKIYRRMPEDSVISINRVKYKTGLSCYCPEALAGENPGGWAYFWLQKKYDKVSFIVGPRDNQASGARGWLTVKADGKIVYEKEVSQQDLAEMVVLDVSGVEQLSFHNVLGDTRILGSITFGVVNMFAYPKGYDQAMIPKAGVVNNSRSKLAQLPDMCKLVSNIPPYSVQGMGAYDKTVFKDESEYYSFSMGGEKFTEGFILTSGNTLFDDHISAYYKFDLAGEFDYMSFTIGALTKRRTQSDDNIRIYCDGKMVLDTLIRVTWPNQRFVIPLNKCRTLTFAKPGTSEQNNSYFGIGDVTLYRGEVQDNSALFSHPKPECPDSIDLIDLCEKPYYHYVGRWLSKLTSFDFNDCFHNGGSMRRFFQMPDGSKIYKGVMLETNIPFAFENITPFKAMFMFATMAGGAISGSDIGAVTGTTAGVGNVGLFNLFRNDAKDKGLEELRQKGLTMGALSIFGAGDKQSSACAFNPFGEYDELTFTVACKSPYVDPMVNAFGGNAKADPVRLDVFADQVKVGEFMVSNEMRPTTYTVPINKCHQLMFWLECGEYRSGQYVLYDMKVRKK